MSIFDKQITPILTYGCPIWGLPNTTNYITIVGTCIPQQGRDLINMIVGETIKTMWVRNTTSTRDLSATQTLLMNLANFDDKECILMNRHKLPHNISIQDVDLEHDKYAYEKVHTNFCKFTLNLPKQTGNNSSWGELGRFPICNKIWSLTTSTRNRKHIY